MTNRFFKIPAIWLAPGLVLFFISIARAGNDRGPPEGIFYLAEEGLLTQARGAPNRSIFISESGRVQGWEVIGESVTKFGESQGAAVSFFFAKVRQAVEAGPYPTMRRSDTTKGVDGAHPPYTQIFCRRGDSLAQLYGGVSEKAPAAVRRIASLAQDLWRVPRAPPEAAYFVQAALLDDETAQIYRARSLLRAVVETDFNQSPVIRRGLGEPFRLFPSSEAELRADAIARELTSRQPAVNLSYAGHAFQLRLLMGASPERTPPP